MSPRACSEVVEFADYIASHSFAAVHRVRVLRPDQSDGAAVSYLINPVHSKASHPVGNTLSAALGVDERVISINRIMREMELGAEVVNPG